MRIAACLAAAAIFSCAVSAAHAQADPKDLLVKSLKAQYVLTTFDKGVKEIVTAGSVVTVKKEGLLVYQVPVSMHPLSTYKNGKISQGFGDALAVCMANSVGRQGGCTGIPQKKLAAGDKFWVSDVSVAKNAIVVVAITDADENGRYIGELKIPFEKGHFPEPEEAMRMVSEVLFAEAPVAPEPQVGGEQPPPDLAPPGGMQSQVAGLYLMTTDPSNQLRLNEDGTFSLTQKGRPYAGTYTSDGNTLVIQQAGRKAVSSGTFRGNKLVDPQGSVWERQGELRAVASEAALAPLAEPVPPPPPPPTVSIGMTKAQVTEAFGEPQRKAVAGVKEIFFYSDLKMKVTFTNGKVSKVE